MVSWAARFAAAASSRRATWASRPRSVGAGGPAQGAEEFTPQVYESAVESCARFFGAMGAESSRSRRRWGSSACRTWSAGRNCSCSRGVGASGPGGPDPPRSGRCWNWRCRSAPTSAKPPAWWRRGRWRWRRRTRAGGGRPRRSAGAGRVAVAAARPRAAWCRRGPVAAAAAARRPPLPSASPPSRTKASRPSASRASTSPSRAALRMALPRRVRRQGGGLKGLNRLGRRVNGSVGSRRVRRPARAAVRPGRRRLALWIRLSGADVVVGGGRPARSTTRSAASRIARA